jgi:hypothetical protein
MNELELERYYENTFAHFESAIEDYRLRAVFRDMSKKRINYIHIASILNEQKKYLKFLLIYTIIKIPIYGYILYFFIKKYIRKRKNKK